MQQNTSRFDSLSTSLVLVSASLMTFGVVMLSSTAATLDDSIVSFISWQTPFVRQAVFAAVGVFLVLACVRVGPGFLRWRPGSMLQPSVALLLVSVVLLACVWVPGVGVESHGRSRWVAFGALRFQPSEISKTALVVFLAALLCRGKTTGRHQTPDLTLAMFVIAVVCAMVGAEDFGTAVLLAAVGGLMLIVRGCPLSTLAAWTIPTCGAFAYLILSHPYRVNRLLSFLHIWDDPHGVGYHPIQSLSAIASGGWTGRGLGAGLAKYGYLPESASDFVFSIICEEIGFLGGAVVILLFVVLVVLGLRTMALAPTGDGGFARLFAFGITATIALQCLMNIAVVTAMAPTKGIPLPLVSAGGSGLLCFSVAVGLLGGVPRCAGGVHARVAYSSPCGQPGDLSGECA